MHLEISITESNNMHLETNIIWSVNMHLAISITGSGNIHLYISITGSGNMHLEISITGSGNIHLMINITRSGNMHLKCGVMYLNVLAVMWILSCRYFLCPGIVTHQNCFQHHAPRPCWPRLFYQVYCLVYYVVCFDFIQVGFDICLPISTHGFWEWFMILKSLPS